MTGSSWKVLIVYDRIGSALTGRDVLCPDGVYRQCRHVECDGDQPREEVRRKFAGADVYAVQVIGPFSNTVGT